MHRLLVLLLPLCLGFTSVLAQADSTLIVTLLDVPSSKGQVLVALYDRAQDWNKPLVAKYVREAPASEGRMDIEFAHLAPGKYAIAVLHDADDSGAMTSNWMGIPKEAYGFGNDARGTFGPPPYEECLIDFEGRGKTRVRLK